MPTPNDIQRQVERLTTDMVGLSLCDHQNYPSLRNIGQGYQEIGISNRTNISYALKNISYRNVYIELNRTQTYNLKMLDGALIYMTYRFRHNQIEKHSLAFFPSPFLEEFQNNPDIYINDEIYAEVIMKNIVPFPLRFDFDCRAFVEIDHPKSHLTLGQYQNCRIPVSTPVTPFYFISFILRNFYHTAYHRFCIKLTSFAHSFEITMTDEEKKLIFIHIPDQKARKSKKNNRRKKNGNR